MAQVDAHTLKIIGMFGGLSLLVLLPLLLPGYILTLDMVFTPYLRMPAEVSSSYVFHAALHVLNIVVPSQVLQKLMLLAILMLSGLGAYWLVRQLQQATHSREYDDWGAGLAGALYMINPYTYSRFMAGQYAVLLGYALLPFFVRSSLRFMAVPSLKGVLKLTAWVVAISIVSVHTLGLVAIVLGLELAIAAYRQWRHRSVIATMARYCLVGLTVFLLASSYWIAPLAAGTSTQGRAVAAFAGDDRKAFATAGGDTVKRIGNVLQLRGFWAEDRNLYQLPQNKLPGWPLVMLSLWVLAGIGAIAWWRQGQRAVTALLVTAGLVAVLLSATGLNGWVSVHLPLLSGFREPQKFVGLLALTYAVTIGQGAAVVLGRLHERAAHTALSGAAVVILLLPLLYTPTMFWGFARQLRPRQYPADWYAVNAVLRADTSDGRVLFLPWHLYMSYGFAGRIIESPAAAFFDRPVLASNELEFMGATPTAPNAQKSLLTHVVLPGASRGTRLGYQLRPLHIKYVLLAKEYDYKKYAYLHKQRDLTAIRETPHLILYEVATHE